MMSSSRMRDSPHHRIVGHYGVIPDAVASLSHVDAHGHSAGILKDLNDLAPENDILTKV